MNSSEITSFDNKKLPFLYETSVSGNKLVTYAKYNGDVIGHCSISANSNRIWMISEWFVDHDYQRQGIGKDLFLYAMKYLNLHYPIPDKIEYVWNGANQYVYDWLQKNFAPVSQCPIAIQKSNTDDDWLSHIYELDVDSVFDYFDLHYQIKDKNDNAIDYDSER